MTNSTALEQAFESDSDTQGQTAQRFRITVPNPMAWLHLGEPSDLGYRGVSLGAEDHVFISARTNALYQAKGQTSHFSWKEWVVFANGDLSMSTGNDAMFATKYKLVLAAGGGYSGDLQLENGVDVPKAYFNPLDYREIIDPCRDGVRKYDDAAADQMKEVKESLGYEVPAAAAAKAAALSGKEKALARLFGAPQKPTENSEGIEMFARKHEGLWGVLSSLRHVTDTLERWTSRPETLPVVGPVVDAMKNVQLAVQGVTGAATGVESLAISLGIQIPGVQSDPKGSIASEYGREVGEASHKSDIVQGKGQSYEQSWDKRANAVAELSGTGFQHMLRPLANRIRGLSYALKNARDALESIGKLLGVPKPSALAVVGRDGVTIVSKKKVFGFAADGFHFVTAQPVEPELNAAQKLLAKAAAAVTPNFIAKLLSSAPKPPPRPGFHVRSAGTVDIRSGRDFNVWATRTYSRVRLMGAWAELAGRESAALTARGGTAEVLGKDVVLGTSVKRAMAAAAKAVAVAAAEAALKGFEDAEKPAAAKVKELQDKLTKLDEEIDTLEDERSQAEAFLNLAKWREKDAAILQKKPQRDALKVELTAAEVTLAPLSPPVVAARESLAQAEGQSAIYEAVVAKNMNWKPDKQALTDTVEVGAFKSVKAYGGEKVEIGSAKTIELKVDPQPPVPTQTAKVVTQAGKVEIDVGGQYSVVVSDSGVTVKAKGQTILTTDGLNATLSVPGGASVEVTPAGVKLGGKLCNLQGNVIQIG